MPILFQTNKSMIRQHVYFSDISRSRQTQLFKTHTYDIIWSWRQANALLCSNKLSGYTHNQM